MAGRVELRDRTGHRGNLAVVLETPTRPDPFCAYQATLQEAPFCAGRPT